MTNENQSAVEVAEFAKSSREVMRVGLSEYKGYKLLQIRAWAKKEDGTAIPTKSGLAIQVYLIGELRAALDKAEAKAKAMGWLKLDGGAHD